jgi:hypothetical protein
MAAATRVPDASTIAIAHPEPQLLHRAGAADQDSHLSMNVIERLAQDGQTYM